MAFKFNPFTGKLDLVSSPTGTPLRVAAFDENGQLVALPNFSYDPTNRYNFGFNQYSNVSVDPDTVSGDNYYGINTLGVNFDLGANTSRQHPRMLSLSSSINDSGTNSSLMGDLMILDSYTNFLGGGTVNSLRGSNFYFELQGNGTAGRVNSLSLGTYGYTLRSTVSLQDSHGLAIQIDHEAGSITDNTVQAFGTYGQILGNIGYYNGAVISPAFGATLAGMTGVGSFPLFQTGTTISGGYTGFQEGANFNSGSNVSSVISFGSYANFKVGSLVNYYTGLNLNPQVLITTLQNFTGVSITPYGPGEATYVRGVSINLTGMTSPNKKLAIDINDGMINQDTMFTTQSGLGFDSGNNYGGLYNPKTDLTGTDFILNSTVSSVLAEASIALGPIGIGLVHVGAVGQTAVSAGKTIDRMSGFMSAMSIPSVPGDGGTLTRYNNFSALGSLSAGGAITLSELVGYYAGGFISGLAANAWGIMIDDSVADNYFGKSLAIGTASKKTSDPEIGLELVSGKTIWAPKVAVGGGSYTSPPRDLTVTGSTRSDSYYSSDDTPGATDDVTLATVTVLHFKNGLYVGNS